MSLVTVCILWHYDTSCCTRLYTKPKAFIILLLKVKRSPHQSANPEILTDFCDGEMCKSHPLFSKKGQSLQIMIYYDDVEVCNPLGSKRKIHKIGNIVMMTKQFWMSQCYLYFPLMM